MRSAAVFVVFVSQFVFAQLPSSQCDSADFSIADCPFNVQTDPFPQPLLASMTNSDLPPSPQPLSLDLVDSTPVATASPISTTTTPPPKQKIRWGRMLLETFTLFSIEQAYVVHDDWDWVAGKYSENGVPFNHYWRDYKQSLDSWVHSGWNDGDPNMYGYVGHPIQGLAVSYIFLQNDPKSEVLEFSKTKAYWRSRLMATIYNAIYSTQWNIGPVSEPTVEKYGTKHRAPWNADGSWPCNTNHCYTGVGQIDLVMTPIGGAGWLIGEDFLDKNVTRRVENHTTNRFLIDTVRCGINPVMVGTNMLHGNRPWYRPRDSKGDFPTLSLKSISQVER